MPEKKEMLRYRWECRCLTLQNFVEGKWVCGCGLKIDPMYAWNIKAEKSKP